MQNNTLHGIGVKVRRNFRVRHVFSIHTLSSGARLPRELRRSLPPLRSGRECSADRLSCLLPSTPLRAGNQALETDSPCGGQLSAALAST